MAVPYNSLKQIGTKIKNLNNVHDSKSDAYCKI